MAERIVIQDRSVIIAADVEAVKLPELVINTCLVEGIGGYKVGAELVIEKGLRNVVDTVKDHSELPVIYDPQKGGTDIPSTGMGFAKACRKSGVDAVILFPLAGPETQSIWTKALQDEGLGVLVGGHMTHPKFLQSEGGYIADDAPGRIFTQAAEQGVRDFVVPGNKAIYVERYRQLLENLFRDEEDKDFRLYAPSFITQGGEISDFAKAAGKRWHAIIGSAIYKAVDMNAAARQMTSQLK